MQNLEINPHKTIYHFLYFPTSSLGYHIPYQHPSVVGGALIIVVTNGSPQSLSRVGENRIESV